MKKAKKIGITLILLISSIQVFGPGKVSLVIEHHSPFNPYKQLIHAIGKVETGCDTTAYNPVEHAVGFFQIRPIRLKDYNKRTGSKYRMKDLYDYRVSEKIFLYYAELAGPFNKEKISKNWNGSGSRTVQYWKKVRKHLQQSLI
jgi:hypothetical protein